MANETLSESSRRWGRWPLLAIALMAGMAGIATAGNATELTVVASQDIRFTGKALEAFRRACPAILRRTDASGLTTGEDWSAACSDPETDPQAFFHRHFDAVRADDGNGLATGYFEPEIPASKTPVSGSVAILKRPGNLVDIDLGAFDPDLRGQRTSGLIDGKRVVPAPDRAAIMAGALAGRDLELAWATDPVAFFFLQIQGSGRLRYPDGTVGRIGFDGKNGHEYVAIGRLLKERGELEVVGMEEIGHWLRQNPERGRKLMEENPSWVFFRSLPAGDEGLTGALGIPLEKEANVAVDPLEVPLGTPVWIETEVGGQSFRTLAIAADTGSAIKGPNRFDIFFGTGERAARLAGPLASPLRAMILLPKPAVARYLAREER